MLLEGALDPQTDVVPEVQEARHWNHDRTHAVCFGLGEALQHSALDLLVALAAVVLGGRHEAIVGLGIGSLPLYAFNGGGAEPDLGDSIGRHPCVGDCDNDGQGTHVHRMSAHKASTGFDDPFKPH